MTLARRFLAKAFNRAQAAQARGKPAHIRLPLTEAQCPDYFVMRNLDEATEFRAELTTAERLGAIRVEPAPRMAPPRDVKAVVVADIEVLATHLGIDLRAGQVALAREQLAPYLDEFPILDEVLNRWGSGKTVRGKEPSAETLKALLDAIKVRVARQCKTDEVLMRRESSRIFNDSKRIEKLSRWLDLLSEGSIVPSGLAKADIFSALGLHKEPQPFLIATDAWITDGHIKSCLFRPYHGLPMAAIEEFGFETMPACVVTVENKSTFHEMAMLAIGTQACLIFSGGMPSPAWHRVYSKILDSLDDDVPIYHFGDLDVGGFRIASAIAEVAKLQGKTLQHWLMDPVLLTGLGYKLYPFKPSQITKMQSWCERIGWDELVDRIANSPGLLEQERIVPSLPLIR
ncbi:MAG: Wadjet anti-phage system protein JetD domain-containing protein [Rhodanobacter sp.]